MKNAIIQKTIFNCLHERNSDLANKYAGNDIDEIPEPDKLQVCIYIDAEFHYMKNKDSLKCAGMLAAITKFFNKVGCKTSAFGTAETWQDLSVIDKKKTKPEKINTCNIKKGIWKATTDYMLCARKRILTGEKVRVLNTEIEDVTGLELVKIKLGDEIFMPYAFAFSKFFIYLK